MKMLRTLANMLGFLLFLSSMTYGSDIYIAQNATGADTGNACTNAHSASWFNTNAIGGNTYHLCGVFTGSAGSTMLSPPSGSAGNILTVKFEDNAIFTAPYWGGMNSGAINISDKSYITIDGGTNGVIRNTANGTSLSYHQASRGIYISNSNNIEIKNLRIDGIYQNKGNVATATDSAGVNSSNIRMEGAMTNILIHHNVLDNSRAGVDFGYGGITDNIQIYNNLIRDHCWGIVVGASSGTPTVTNVKIYKNEIAGWLNWQCPANATFCTNKTDTYHTDGIILWQTRGGTFSPEIYSNYIHGDLGRGSATGFIFCTYGSGSSGDAISCKIYNNLLVNEGGFSTPIWIGGANINTKMYNNVIKTTPTAGSGAVQVYTTGSGKNIEFINNIVYYGRMALQTSDGGYAQFSKVDRNLYYLINSVNDPTGESWRTINLSTDWATWRGLGFDTNSFKNSNPLFLSSTDFRLKSGSPAINAGAPLTSYFTTDYTGAVRGTNWDIGAYEYSGSDSGLGSGSVPQYPNIMGISP